MTFDRKLLVVGLVLSAAVFAVATTILIALGSGLAESLIGGVITTGVFAVLALKSLRL